MARRKKITACQAKQRLVDEGIDFKKSFFTLRSSDVRKVLEVARAAGYRKSKNAPGSTARMYFRYLARKKGC